MSILHRSQAHRRLRLAFQIGCAIVAITVIVVKDLFSSTSYSLGVSFLMIAFLLFTYVLLLRSRRQRAEKSTHDHRLL